MPIQELLFNVLLRPQAYLDPGSGSFILQVVIAGALGIGLALRTYWAKIVSGIKGIFSRRDGEANREPNAEE